MARATTVQVATPNACKKRNATSADRLWTITHARLTNVNTPNPHSNTGRLP